MGYQEPCPLLPLFWLNFFSSTLKGHSPTTPRVPFPSLHSLSHGHFSRLRHPGICHTPGYERTRLPPTPLSPTLDEATRYTERPSIELNFSGSGPNIVNSFVVNRPLYSISSDSRRTKLYSQRDNTEVPPIY